MALPKKRQAKNKRSHYTFKNWQRDEGGKVLKGHPYDVKPFHKSMPDLVGTAVYNPVKKTRTLVNLNIDIDYSRTDPKWCLGGRIVWPWVLRHLEKEHPVLASMIGCVVKSTSGSGFHFLIPTRSIELGATKQYFYQKKAERNQRRLIVLLNQMGIGADSSAIGLSRDHPNHFNPERVLFGSPENLDEGRRKGSIDQMAVLADYLDSLGIVANQAKEKPFKDERVQKGWAKLYLHGAELYAEGETTFYLSTKEVLELTGIKSEKVVRRDLKGNVFSWLDSSYCGRLDGWKLSITDGLSLLSEAHFCISLPEKRLKANIKRLLSLCPPEEVEDGERNLWITGVVLGLKHAGIYRNECYALLSDLVKRIPGYKFSRNCQKFGSIVRSIYKNKKEYFGRLPDLFLPEWLFAKAPEESGTSRLEGDKVPGGASANSGDATEDFAEEKLLTQREREVSADLPQSGDSRPTDVEQKNEHLIESWLRGLFPQALEGKASAHLAQNILPFPEASNFDSETKRTTLMPRVKKRLSDVRAANFKARHPLDRFENAVGTCRASMKNLLRYLENFDHTLRYDNVPKGVYPRVSRAFIVMPPEMQKEAVEILRDVLKEHETKG